MLSKMLKRVGFFVVLLLCGVSSHALAIPVGELIANGGFQTSGGVASLAGWTQGGTANGRASTNAINTSGGNAGFNGFFTSAFATLGDDSGGVGNPPNSGTHSLSQTFDLPFFLDEVAIASYDLVVSDPRPLRGRFNIE